MGIFNKIDPSQISNFDFLAYVTPQMYGCAGDGVTDDTANLTTCLNSGKPVLLVGKFLVTSAVVVNLNYSTGPFGLNIEGMGSQASEIILGSTSACLQVSISYAGNNAGTNTQVVLRDFNIAPNVAGCTYGLLITGSPELGSSQPNFLVDNVHVIPYGGCYAVNGIYLKDVRGYHLRGCHVVMSGTTGTGITHTSTDNGASGNAPVDCNITECHVLYGNNSIYLSPSGDTNHAYSNDWQGIHINHCTLLAANYNIHATSSDGNSNWVEITGCTCSFNTCGIETDNVQSAHISGCNFQNLSGTTNAFIWISANMTIVVMTTVMGNVFYNAPYSGGTAVGTGASGGAVMKCIATGNVSYGYGGTSLAYNGVTGSNNN